LDSDPALLTVVQARAEIRARRLSAVELTEAVLARTERLNPRLKAYLHVDREGALAQAHAADRRANQPPLLGIPVCVKDVIDVAGVPTTAGAARWRRVPELDAAAVARLRAAGAIVIGKGHTNEFAYGIDGRNPHWGDCCNPFDPARMTGGSSSGPAAATSAGMALAGLGTDTSGSLRVPASFCGLVGVRPTLGLVSLSGVVPLAWSYDTIGPLTRSVADARLLLDALTGTSDKPPRDDHGGGRLGGVRIGLPEQLLEAAEPYVANAVAEAAARLEALGATVAPARVELLRYATAIHLIVQHAEAASVHRPWFAAQRPYYSEPVRIRLEAGGLLPATAYLAAQRARRLLIDSFADAIRRLDVLLAPTTPFVAPPRDVTEATIRGRQHELRSGLLGCTLAPSQLAGPVVAVPIGRRDGLPYGMQIIGRPLSEQLLLRVAAACEQRYEWHERRPSI
jgi:aspartyl-tRNA(Asn)/glutamyl-tRNA(Gln) amidotransferase subunit A